MTKENDQLLLNENSSSMRVLVEQFRLLENRVPGNLRSPLEDQLPSTVFASASTDSGSMQTH